VSLKNIPDIIDCHLMKDYPSLIIFGTNIPDTTGHQTSVAISHLTQRMLVHYLGKAEQAKYALK